MISKYPSLPASSKRVIVVVVSAILILIIGSALTAQGSKKPTLVEVEDTQPAKVRIVRKTNNVLKSTDGGVEFALNPNKIQRNAKKIGRGNDILVAGAGKKYVTVFVQVRNSEKKRVTLRPADQVLITKSGERVVIDKELQKYITNGNWYRNVPSNGHSSGTLVFEIDADDKVDSIEFRKDKKSGGTKISLK